MKRIAFLAVALSFAPGCSLFGPKPTRSPIQVEAVRSRNLDLTAEASGTIEAIEILDIKSKAGGQVIEVTVESGSEVKPGDLLVRIDPRDVEQRLAQAQASRDAALTRRDISFENRKAQREMFAQGIISSQEFRTGANDSASAATSLMSAEAALALARQQMEDVTIRAIKEGTIIEKLVAVGAVIQSSSSGTSPGTNLLRMADLTKVRIRASFNETDIANIRVGLPVNVTVDAFPGETFIGELTKIEPIAIQQQSVTMFPVQIAIDNSDRRLKPGMNAEVSVTVMEVFDVLAVPSDAIRTTQEAAYTAGLLKLNPDTVKAQVDAQIAAMSGMGAAAPSGVAGTTVGQAFPGDIELVAFQPQQGRGRRGGRGGRAGGEQQQVTAEECAPIKAAYDKNPAAQKKLDSLRLVMRSSRPTGGRTGGTQPAQSTAGQPSGRGGQGQTTNPVLAEMNQIYATLGVDSRLAQRCGSLLMGPLPASAGRTGGANAGGGRTGGGGGAQAEGGNNRGQLAAGGGFGANGGRGRVPQNLRLVYLADSGKTGRTYTPRVIRTGLARFDYTEVLDGLVEGDVVVLMSSAVLAQQQEAARERAQGAAQGGGIFGNVPGRGGPGGGGPGGRGGGGPGGGGGGRGGGNDRGGGGPGGGGGGRGGGGD